MNCKVDAELIEGLAKKQLKILDSKLAECDDITRSVILVEVCRTMDYFFVGKHFGISNNNGIDEPEFSIMSRGWNPLLSRLMPSLCLHNGMPLMESTKDSSGMAFSLLYAFGVYVTLKQTADMLRYKIVSLKRNKEKFHVSINNLLTSDHHLDRVEDQRFLDFESEQNKQTNTQPALSSFMVKDIEDRMRKLIFPWDSGKGILVGYGAEPEVDDHFLAIATNLVINWRDEAGIHPDAEIDSVSVVNLVAITSIICSFYLKHINFVHIGLKHLDSINYLMSLTIWQPLEKLLNGVPECSGVDEKSLKFVNGGDKLVH